MTRDELALIVTMQRRRSALLDQIADIERERARLALLAAALRAEREAISERLAHAPEHTGAAA